MRKLLPLLLLFGLACDFLTPRATPDPAVTAGSTVASAIPAPPTQTASPWPATATSPPAQTPAPTAARAEALAAGDVVFHPDPQLYAGDIVSLEIRAPQPSAKWEGLPVSVYAGSMNGTPLGTAKFGPHGLGGRMQATLTWAWDTTGLEGPQTLVIAVEAAGPAGVDLLTLTVNLLPGSLRPMPEPLAQWATAESACCVFHYLTATAAARDIERIRAEADAAFARAEVALGVRQRRKVTINLLSRLLGHGGFATDEISVTYIDRNPAGNDLGTVFVHEATHLLDRQLAQNRPVLMTEGLAVYVAGGHFKPEALDQRAAALLALDAYIPLQELADSFYPAQHEIGYLEAGAFIHYLVETYGWERFRAFYGSFEQVPSEAQMLDRALRAQFGQSLASMEAAWLAHLRTLPPDPDEMADLRLTIALFDTLRRYQELDDPAAYFLHAWLPSASEARARGIVADFVRHPTAPENVALETMLVRAGHALEQDDFDTADLLLASVNAVLEAHNLFFDPLAASYLGLVADLRTAGYEAQTISLEGEVARVTAIRAWPELHALTLTRTPSGWASSAGALRSRDALSHGIIFVGQ